MELFWETVAFVVKGGAALVCVVVAFACIAAIGRRGRSSAPRLQIEALGERYEGFAEALRSAAWGKKALRARAREERRARRAHDEDARPSAFVIDFEGDLLATGVRHLREEVSVILAAAKGDDEVIVRLESGGGSVAHYGLAAAQLARLRERKIKVTVCIDRIAASGGYMMAAAADAIIAAPFAIIGSIGVIAQVPNLHRLLQRHDVDYHELTAGEFKRTLSVLGEVTEKGRQKFQEQLEEIHALFKGFLREQRPALDVDRVATGEFWLARRAKELGLVDRIATSDDYVLERAAHAKVLRLRYKPPRDWRANMRRTAVLAVERALLAGFTRLQRLSLP